MKLPRWARRGANDVVDVFWCIGQAALILGELVAERWSLTVAAHRARRAQR